MDTADFTYSVVTGLVSSVVTYSFVCLRRWLGLRRRFSGLAGRYAHYTVEPSKPADGVTVVEYAGENILLTRGSSPDGEWEGRITMNSDIPELGSGIYRYISRVDCGVHQIQVNPKDQSIFVLVVNTSHGVNNTSAYVWRKLNDKASKA